jgi:hypothetical protein
MPPAASGFAAATGVKPVPVNPLSIWSFSMSVSIYDVSIPAFISGLNNLSGILTRAAEQAEAKKIDQSVLVNSRLAPDMFPLSRQVQIATDGVKGCAARLAGIDIPSYEDTESNFAELQARIAKTVAFLQSVSREQIEGSEAKTITLKVGGQEMSFEGLGYVTSFVIPNFYFHLTSTYAILRHNGIDIGKKDFLGAR